LNVCREVNVDIIDPMVTNAETAWLAHSVPAWLAVAGMLCVSLVVRGRIAAAVAARLARRRHSGSAADASLVWAAPIATPAQIVAAAIGGAVLAGGGALLVAPALVAALLTGPSAVLAAWAVLGALELRYRDRLDRALPPAVARLAARLRSGESFQSALARIVADLPDGPLRAEWGFVVERLGAPMAAGGAAQPADVVRALIEQTPSARHAVLLEHLEVALRQTHDVLSRRVQAAAEALYAAEQRRSAAATELAQMRYSGVAIGLAGLGMAGYLALTQAERVALAYSGPLGVAAGCAVALALAAPLVAGQVLARADDVDY
jgi:Flp pilus assembly protein TadB